jgi:FkbM family methyltransferase
MSLPNIQVIDTKLGRFLSFATDFGISVALKAGRYETALINMAIEVVQRQNCTGLLLDVGAHIGTFCIPVALATKCRVHAFEVQPVISQVLSANLLLNGVDARVENVLLAPPDHMPMESIPIIDYTKPGNFGAYTTDRELFETRFFRKMQRTGKQELIRAMTLDAFAITDISLVKLDVEGSEQDILKGGIETLSRSNYPPLIFESWDKNWWQDKRRQLFEFVTDLGYVITGAGDDNFIAHHKDRPMHTAST